MAEVGSRIKVKLCKCCDNDLSGYNPYVYDDFSEIPLNNIDVEVVEVEDCDNTTFNPPQEI